MTTLFDEPKTAEPLILREYQEHAVDECRRAISEWIDVKMRRDSVEEIVRRRVRPVLSAPTGAGKCLVASAIFAAARARGRTCAFVVPLLSLIPQTYRAFKRAGMDHIGVVQGDNLLTDHTAPVQICSIQTVGRRRRPQADVVLFDECVVRGTKIMTPFGEKNIEDLKEGDYVCNAIGVGRIKAISRRVATPISIGMSNGRTLRITRNHPAFSGAGWTACGELERDSFLFSREGLRTMWRSVPPTCVRGGESMEGSDAVSGLRKNKNWLMAAASEFFAKNVRCLWRDVFRHDGRRSDRQRKGMGAAEMLLDILCQEVVKSDALGCVTPETARHLQAHWSRAERSRREWKAYDEAARSDACDLGGGVESRVCSNDGYAARLWHSRELQARLGEAFGKARRGIEWWIAQLSAGARTGREKGSVFGDVRVESISPKECGRIDDVFNLHVSGHPSYFAEGVLVHNCHIFHKAHQDWMDEADPGTVFIGLSATPWRKGLVDYFDRMIVVETTYGLIQKGYLSPFRAFAPSVPDLSDVKIVAGDYHEGQLGAAMNKPKLIADVVTTWLEKAERRKTLVFAVNCAHAQALQAQFLAAGVRTGYVDAYTKVEGPGGREELVDKLRTGELEVICNVGTMTTGVDAPFVSCISMARPTRSEMLYLQIVGRGLRTAPGKENCLVFDHSDTIARLGMPDEIYYDSFPWEPEEQQKAAGRKEALPKACPQCAFMKPARVLKCPACGFETAPKSKIACEEGELAEIGSKRKPKEQADMETKQRWYSGLIWIARDRGKKDGWAYYAFRDKFGVAPANTLQKTPRYPDAVIFGWEKSRRIAFAKAKEKERKGSPPGDDGAQPPWMTERTT